MNRIRSERGVALAVAIFALVVVGGLVTAGFFVGVQEQRTGRSTVKLSQAFAAADGGAETAVGTWNTATYNVLAVGDSITIGRTQLANNAGWYRGSIRRLNTELFLVRVEGFSQDSTARQQVGVVVRLKPIDVLFNAALKSQGDLKIGGSSLISGIDESPAGWTGCPALRPTQPGIRMPKADSLDISTSGCGGYSCVAGSPKILSDNTINDSTLSHFGEATFADLKSMATKIVPGGTQSAAPTLNGAACDTANLWNWGEPATATPFAVCRNYFPIIWVDGNLQINGARGQGILLVDGDLKVSGGFEFYGPVIIKGSLTSTGTGGHFNGGVIARNVDLEQLTVLGNATINYSSCALAFALNASASGSQMRERGWLNLP
jgi:hypothetical protein